MARVTVEDCLKHVKNRFELVRLAAARARQLDRGYTPKLDNTEGEKSTLLALREIAAGKIDPAMLNDNRVDEREGDQDFQVSIHQIAERERQKRKTEEAAVIAEEEKQATVAKAAEEAVETQMSEQAAEGVEDPKEA